VITAGQTATVINRVATALDGVAMRRTCAVRSVGSVVAGGVCNRPAGLSTHSVCSMWYYCSDR